MSQANLFTEFRKKKHFGSLDGIRALSIVGVVWHHCARNAALPFAPEGAMGVPLFFAISGFLITTLLLRERERAGDISLKAFYARRSLRIFPLYYTVLIAYVIVVLFFERDAEDRSEFLHNLRYYFTYTSNWFVGDGHGAPLPGDGRVIFYFAWSLATEEQFYLLWPSVEKYLGAKRVHLPIVVALGLVVAFALVATDVVHMQGIGRNIVVSIAPAICLGVVLAHLLHDERTFNVLAKILAPKWASPVLLVAVVVALMGTGFATTMLSFALMTLFVGACSIREDHGLARVMKLPPLVSIGQVSYGVYLMHMLVLNLVEKVLGKVGIDHRVPIFVAALCVTWGVAWTSFHTYEAQWLKLKKRFER